MKRLASPLLRSSQKLRRLASTGSFWNENRVLEGLIWTVYDVFVTNFNYRFVWKAPKELHLKHYLENMKNSKTHLDVGPGEQKKTVS